MHPLPAHPWPLPGSIDVDADGTGRVLRLRGDLDSEVVARFRTLRGAEPVVVDAIDAGDVTFVSSTGVAVLLRCVEESEAAGHAPVLRGSSRVVDRVLQVAAIDHRFPRAR